MKVHFRIFERHETAATVSLKATRYGVENDESYKGPDYLDVTLYKHRHGSTQHEIDDYKIGWLITLNIQKAHETTRPLPNDPIDGQPPLKQTDSNSDSPWPHAAASKAYDEPEPAEAFPDIPRNKSGE